MLLFLLHPRLYAHAFFNSKDVPFLAMFMIALCLVHRAFEKDTVRAFAVLGAAAAVLMNLRIMGVMLFAAVLGMRALDLLHAAQWSERRRVLKTTGSVRGGGRRAPRRCTRSVRTCGATRVSSPRRSGSSPNIRITSWQALSGQD